MPGEIMRTVSALVASAGLVAAVVVSQGCGSASKPVGFNEGEDSGSDGGDEGSVPGQGEPGPVFSDDAGDAKNGTLLTPDAACATATAETKRDPVYLLFVVDGSGSMNSNSKWTAQTAALDAIFDDMLAQADKDLGVGLIVFSDSMDPTRGSGPYPSSADVFVGYVDQLQHDALRTRVDSSAPNDLTPTVPALTGAYRELENIIVAPPLPKNGRKVVVLLSDGAPNVGGGQPECLAVVANELAKAAPLGPIQTFSVGVGPFPSADTSSYDPSFMGQLAQAGGTAPLGCTPSSQNPASICHFQVTPNGKPIAQIKQEFVDAINTIRGQVTSCDFALDFTTGQKVDPSHVNVVYTDGTGTQHIIPQDGAAGWTYDNPADPHRVVLHGTACTQMRGDPKAKVSILLGCTTQTN